MKQIILQIAGKLRGKLSRVTEIFGLPTNVKKCFSNLTFGKLNFSVYHSVYHSVYRETPVNKGYTLKVNQVNRKLYKRFVFNRYSENRGKNTIKNA